jgi:UDP-galactopyranose mutase
MYDFIIIGSGLFGSVFANEAKTNGKKVLVIDKRPHIGGNVYTSDYQGINVHEYGAHIWHTPSKKIHLYMSQFCEFNNYVHRVKVNYNDNVYSFPINLMTFNQVFGINKPKDAIDFIEKYKKSIIVNNLEDFAISQVGKELYEIFIKDYTTKQWGREPDKLPPSIIKRIPVRFDYNDRYYPDEHRFEGIPIGGYTPIIEQMLSGVEVKLSEDYFESKKIIEKLSDKIIYTGPLDKFFDYSEGQLQYRSLHFQKEYHSGDYQGCAQMNFASKSIPYTRILEHKHFEFIKNENTVITKEFPTEYDGSNEPYYPINDDINKAVAEKYRFMSKVNPKYYFGGRLATYNYYDMHQVVASALQLSSKIL